MLPLSLSRVANLSRAKLPVRCVTLAVLAAGLMAGPALAQTNSPPKAKAKAQTQAQTETKAPKKSLQAASRISEFAASDLRQRDRPAHLGRHAELFDPRGPRRLADPAGGRHEARPGRFRARGGAAARAARDHRRPPPQHASGDVFDANLTAAIRRFQTRHGLEETGTIGQRTLTALNVPVTRRLRQLAGLARPDRQRWISPSASATWW